MLFVASQTFCVVFGELKVASLIISHLIWYLPTGMSVLKKICGAGPKADMWQMWVVGVAD